MAEGVVAFFVILLLVCAICALVSMTIAEGKRLSSWKWFLVGFLLGPLGVVTALLIDEAPWVPQDRRRRQCPRCSVYENVHVDAESYDCWQCGTSVEVYAPPIPIPAMRMPGWQLFR